MAWELIPAIWLISKLPSLQPNQSTMD